MSEKTKKQSATAPKKKKIVLAQIVVPLPPEATTSGYKGLKIETEFKRGKGDMRLAMYSCFCT